MTLNNNSSISIILREYKEEHISENEATQLIEDLYRYRYIYTPIFPSWPQITYETQQPQHFEITCKQ